MIEDLIEITELIRLLGYDDERSVTTWCRKHKIPIFDLGKKKYFSNIILEMYIEEEMKAYLAANYHNPDEIMQAIKNDDKVKLAEQLNAPINDKEKKKFIIKQKLSKDAEEFLKNLKIA